MESRGSRQYIIFAGMSFRETDNEDNGEDNQSSDPVAVMVDSALDQVARGADDGTGHLSFEYYRTPVTYDMGIAGEKFKEICISARGFSISKIKKKLNYKIPSYYKGGGSIGPGMFGMSYTALEGGAYIQRNSHDNKAIHFYYYGDDFYCYYGTSNMGAYLSIRLSIEGVATQPAPPPTKGSGVPTLRLTEHPNTPTPQPPAPKPAAPATKKPETKFYEDTREYKFTVDRDGRSVTTCTDRPVSGPNRISGGGCLDRRGKGLVTQEGGTGNLTAAQEAEIQQKVSAYNQQVAAQAEARRLQTEKAAAERAEYNRKMAEWRANVAACNAGDTSKCAR